MKLQDSHQCTLAINSCLFSFEHTDVHVVCRKSYDGSKVAFKLAFKVAFKNIYEKYFLFFHA